MKLLVAIVHTEDAGHLVDGLLEREFRATRLHSSGGFLKQSNATVILGVEDAQVDAALAVIRENCHSRTQLVNPMPPIMEPGEFYMPYPVEVEVGGLRAALDAVPVTLSTMGRGLDDDEQAFLSAAAAGRHAARLLTPHGTGTGALHNE